MTTTRFFGYARWSQVALTYGLMLLLACIGFWVRSEKFAELSVSFNIRITVFSIIMIVSFWELLRAIDRALDRRMPFENGVTRRVAVQLVLGGASGLLMRFLIYYFGEPYLPFRLDQMFLATTWLLYLIIPTVANLGFFTIDMIERWKRSLIIAERLEKEKAQVQFDNLKNQLNPHFLFNALASLNSLISEDPKLASQFLQQLSRVYRYVLQNKDTTLVSLEKEIDFIQHYTSLLKTRFAGFLAIEFDIPEHARSRSIVPVTLQILMENALKHNIVDKSKPLSIRINVSGDYLEVSNNLQERKKVDTSNEQGLQNLKILYHYLSDKPLVVDKQADRFIVRVPLI